MWKKTSSGQKKNNNNNNNIVQLNLNLSKMVYYVWGYLQKETNITLEIFFSNCLEQWSEQWYKIVGLVKGRKYKTIDYDKKKFE